MSARGRFLSAGLLGVMMMRDHAPCCCAQNRVALADEMSTDTACGCTADAPLGQDRRRGRDQQREDEELNKTHTDSFNKYWHRTYLRQRCAVP